ncbi:hypothetical protein ZIOFF_071618 [Zingiber officinale]|uniref:Cytochrome b5 heme-binding domain-containing protein n=1 Tax=Zingiber officinale TaxID=94328 RepID=A0A8J5C1G8_ZINOF|nr:hypothetical protein ZIOFF_071618 [Zingiber officinale]
MPFFVHGLVRYSGVLGVEEPHQSIPYLVVKLYSGDDTIGEGTPRNRSSGDGVGPIAQRIRACGDKPWSRGVSLGSNTSESKAILSWVASHVDQAIGGPVTDGLAGREELLTLLWSDMIVYDVTKFLEDHPGGDEILLASTGKDATDDFEDIGHSTTARAMMDEYYVGEIDAATISKKATYTPPNQPHHNQDRTSEFIVRILQFLVPLLILGLAVGIKFYTKSS